MQSLVLTSYSITNTTATLHYAITNEVCTKSKGAIKWLLYTKQHYAKLVFWKRFHQDKPAYAFTTESAQASLAWVEHPQNKDLLVPDLCGCILNSAVLACLLAQILKECPWLLAVP